MDTPNIQDGDFRGFTSGQKLKKPEDRGAVQPIHADRDIFDNPQLMNDLEKIQPGFRNWMQQQREQKMQDESESEPPKSEHPLEDLFGKDMMERLANNNVRPRGGSGEMSLVIPPQFQIDEEELPKRELASESQQTKPRGAVEDAPRIPELPEKKGYETSARRLASRNAPRGTAKFYGY